MTRATKTAHIQVLFNSPQFNLTGSRYWNSINPYLIPVSPTTDWDFYCQHSPENIARLEGLGFLDTYQDELYRDNSAECVYVHPEAQNIQVVTRKSVHVYKQVMDFIHIGYYRDFLWKSGPNKPKRAVIRERINTLLGYVDPAGFALK